MKLPLVRRSKYEDTLKQVGYWQERSKFVLTIPYLKIDGIGDIQIYCDDKEQADLIKAKLSAKQTKGTSK